LDLVLVGSESAVARVQGLGGSPRFPRTSAGSWGRSHLHLLGV